MTWALPAGRNQDLKPGSQSCTTRCCGVVREIRTLNAILVPVAIVTAEESLGKTQTITRIDLVVLENVGKVADIEAAVAESLNAEARYTTQEVRSCHNSVSHTT
jgi:D-ribose pyranose/furanose isomerase RbsD